MLINNFRLVWSCVYKPCVTNLSWEMMRRLNNDKRNQAVGMLHNGMTPDGVVAAFNVHQNTKSRLKHWQKCQKQN